MPKAQIVPLDHVAGAIHVIRGQRVVLDSDLAELYGVTVSRLNEQVRRNLERFPDDFAFKLTTGEVDSLRSQIAISSSHGGRRYLPRVFTEHGAVMAASVLNSPRAVEMSILVVRAFVQLRGLVATHKNLAAKLDELERRYAHHDKQIVALLDAIRALMNPPPGRKRRIGFGT